MVPIKAIKIAKKTLESSANYKAQVGLPLSFYYNTYNTGYNLSILWEHISLEASACGILLKYLCLYYYSYYLYISQMIIQSYAITIGTNDFLQRNHY